MGGVLTQGLSQGADQTYSFNGGYRTHLFEMAVEDGKDITFVGTMSDGPQTVAGRAFPANHEGHAGWAIYDYQEIIPTPALTFEPHIILLEIGAMDMMSELASSAPANLTATVEEIRAHSPDSLIAISTVPPIFANMGAVEALNNNVGEIAGRSSSDRIISVDIGAISLASPLAPDVAGYQAMAEQWYEAIKPYLR